jgi:hypothetical protein
VRARLGVFAALLVGLAVTCSALGRVAYEAQSAPVVFITATPEPPRPGPYPNRIFVLDADTGAVLPDAWLVVDGATYPVDGRGFTLSMRTETMVDMIVGAPGYEVEQRQVTLGPDNPVTAVRLLPRP